MNDWIEQKFLPLLMAFAAGVIVASCDDKRDMALACAEPVTAGMYAEAAQ